MKSWLGFSTGACALVVGAALVVPSGQAVAMDAGKAAEAAGGGGAGLSEIESLMADHHMFMMKMEMRKTNLKAIQTFWSKGDVKGAVAALAKAGPEDTALVHDVLASIDAAFRPAGGGGSPGQGMTLEHCGALLPFVDMLVSSGSSGRPERDLPLALGLAEGWLSAFSELVRSVLLRKSAESKSDGRNSAIDFSFEERVDKCRLTRDGFLRLKKSLEQRVTKGSSVPRAQRLAAAIQAQLAGV